MLDDSTSTWFQQPCGRSLNESNVIQSVGPREKCHRGIKVRDLTISRYCLLRNVWGVRDDQIDTALKRRDRVSDVCRMNNNVDVATLVRSQGNASLDVSTAWTREFAHSVAIASAIAPEPAHRSTTMGASSWSANNLNAASTTTSVSGRGMNTPGPTDTVL